MGVGGYCKEDCRVEAAPKLDQAGKDPEPGMAFSMANTRPSSFPNTKELHNFSPFL